MSNSGSVIDIPTRLEEPGRVMIFESDEFAVLAAPIVIGLLARSMVTGIIVGVALYFLWTRIKGENGFYALWALLYWAMPRSVSGLKALPESAVMRWSA